MDCIVQYLENTGSNAYTSDKMPSAFPAPVVLTPIFTEMKTYFITGGAGFIGGNFIINLMKAGQAKVINFDKLTYAGNLDTLAFLKSDCSAIVLRLIHKNRSSVIFFILGQSQLQ